MARNFLGPDSVKSAYGVSTRTTGGTPSDGSFTAVPSDGELAVDTTNNLLYFRSGGTWRSTSSGTASGGTSTVSIPFTDGDTVRRVTVTDAAITSSSNITGTIRRPNSADDSADKGYLYTANVVRVGTGSFDVLIAATAWDNNDTTANPPNETVQYIYTTGASSGAVVQPQFRGYHSATQAVSGGSSTTLPFDSERWDTDNGHFTSSANLTGTVAKTSGNAVLVGTGTAFTTELSVGQVVEVLGSGTDWRVVTTITDDTHVTMSQTFNNTASGVTATRLNKNYTIRTAGLYIATFKMTWPLGSNSENIAQIYLNFGSGAGKAIGAGWIKQASGDVNVPDLTVEAQWQCAQWDQLCCYQQTAASMTIPAGSASDPHAGPEFSVVRVSA